MWATGADEAAVGFEGGAAMSLARDDFADMFVVYSPSSSLPVSWLASASVMYVPVEVAGS
jgi:hypothetical protein